MGASSLSDAELLAIFLRTGIHKMPVLELANCLLEEFGLRALFMADPTSFCRHRGLGLTKYAQLQASLEVTRRYLLEQLKAKDILTSPEQTKLFLTDLLRDKPREEFAVIFLDSQHRVLSCESLFLVRLIVHLCIQEKW